MTTRMNIVKTLVAAAAGLLLVSALAAPALADRGSKSGIRSAIATDEPTTIIGALEDAEFLICGSCIYDVMQLLDHPEYTVREVAGWWFSRREAQMKEITEGSLAYLAGNDSVKARNAADVLGAFRQRSTVPALSAAVQRAELDAEARAAAARALGLIAHPDANPALAAAMQDSDATVRAAAAEAWLAIRGQTDAAPLVALVADSDNVVRRKAAGAIGNLRDAAGRVALEQQLTTDPDPVVRRNAAWALGRIGDASSRSVLEAASADESGLVRMVARQALRELN